MKKIGVTQGIPKTEVREFLFGKIDKLTLLRKKQHLFYLVNLFKLICVQFGQVLQIGQSDYSDFIK